MRAAANQLMAHYALREGDLPLGADDKEQLLRDNGWETMEALFEWVGQLIPELEAVKQELITIANMSSKEVRP